MEDIIDKINTGNQTERVIGILLFEPNRPEK